MLYELIDDILPTIEANPILVGWRGSIAHGMYVPPEDEMGTDDKDIMAVVVPNLDTYFGLDNFGSRGTKEISQGSWDIVCYEIRKYISLLAQGNPNVLSLLWIDDEFLITESWAGLQLRKQREIFNGKHLYNSFIGYAHAQLERMTRGESATGRGFMGEKRKEIRAKFGYDTKNASHLIRLLRMGIEFFDTGKLNVNRKNIDAEELIDIKKGRWSLEQVNETANQLFAQAKHSIAISNLPEQPDHKRISQLCSSLVRYELIEQKGGWWN